MSRDFLREAVRIYSKQVDYVLEDAQNTLKHVLTTVNTNLPDDATHAPFHAITLLEKFELDSLELDDCDKDWCEDSYLKSKDDITLAGIDIAYENLSCDHVASYFLIFPLIPINIY
ncbi:hypothetical protein Salat_2728200 [Sesamum alatum]|uniref:Uncharacterized protein n=1 Tax=Sesamum alatum TaxID=300844 RepID=A0AAE1XKM1_9LAMI|nr:hypothetical protein Salat_2728200 [Sesamum alatum]